MVRERIVLTTYYKGLNTDRTSVEFSVPKDWLSDYIEYEVGIALDEWLSEYTWDESAEIMTIAKEQKVFRYASACKSK